MKHTYLRNCRYDRALKLPGKKFVHNYYELAAEISLMEDSDFRQRLNEFPSWIIENYDDDELAAALKGVKNKKRYASIIEKRVRQLERVSAQKNRVSPAWIIALVLAVIIIVQYAYFTYVSYGHEEARRVLVKELSIGAGQQDITREIIRELEAKNTALEEKMQILENEKIQLLSKPYVRGPQDWISEQQIRVSGNNVNIHVGRGPVIAAIAGTGSMLPVLTKTSHAIEIIPESPSELMVGDIIAYKLENEYIIHRIERVGEDEFGWYAVTKGDNSFVADTEKVRFGQVERVVVGIIY